MILGIDPGQTGGLVVLDEKGDLLDKLVMPTIGSHIDLKLLHVWLTADDPFSHCFIEKSQPMPRQGVSSVFKYGRTFGMIEALVSAAGIPYEMVTPQKWTKEMHKGIEKSIPPKDRSRIALSRLFPEVDLRVSERAKKPHEGLMDALLIAEYGRRQWQK